MSLSPFNESRLRDTPKLKETIKNRLALTSGTQIINSIITKHHSKSQEESSDYSTVDLILRTNDCQDFNIYKKFSNIGASKSYHDKFRTLEELSTRNSIKKFKFVKELAKVPATTQELQRDKSRVKIVRRASTNDTLAQLYHRSHTSNFRRRDHLLRLQKAEAA